MGTQIIIIADNSSRLETVISILYLSISMNPPSMILYDFNNYEELSKKGCDCTFWGTLFTALPGEVTLGPNSVARSLELDAWTTYM